VWSIWAIWIVAAYLIGSVPVGLLLGKMRGVDLRGHGSGNIGATNAMRVLGRRLGSLCFALDVVKGAAPVLGSGVAMNVLGRGALDAAHTGPWMAVGLAAVLGHVFPIYLRFKGGKGVATAFGALVAFWPWMTLAALLALMVWIIVAVLTRYVSVASIAAALVLPAAMVVSHMTGWPAGGEGVRSQSGGWPFLGLAIVLSALVIWKHRGNIARLMAGTEHVIGGRKADLSKAHASEQGQ
jgi:glycerol-3-phosphate acyltransferase PlsY